MPVKIEEVKKEVLEGFNIPVNVVSYKEIIDSTIKIIAKEGFELVQESYKSTLKGTIAVGMYCIKKAGEHYLFTWSHAYDKSQKFKCAFGLYEGYATGSDKDPKWLFTNEKTYKAVNQIAADIYDYINIEFSNVAHSALEFDQFISKCSDKKIDFEETAALLGRLFVVEGIITSSQLNNIKSELFLISGLDMNKVYKCISHNMNDTHPSSFVDNYSALYQFFINELATKVIEDNKDKEKLIVAMEEFKKQPWQLISIDESVSEKLTRTVVFL